MERISFPAEYPAIAAPLITCPGAARLTTIAQYLFKRRHQSVRRIPPIGGIPEIQVNLIYPVRQMHISASALAGFIPELQLWQRAIIGHSNTSLQTNCCAIKRPSYGYRIHQDDTLRQFGWEHPTNRKTLPISFWLQRHQRGILKSNYTHLFIAGQQQGGQAVQDGQMANQHDATSC